MAARRVALAALCLAIQAPQLLARFRHAWPEPPAATACTPAGRGVAPRHWIGCAEDPGPERALSGPERLAAGLAVELNEATPEELAGVPGLSPRLAIEVVRDRVRRGPFSNIDDLIRVRGIGPSRLERARPFLAIGP
jgi:competence protein ComEA